MKKAVFFLAAVMAVFFSFVFADETPAVITPVTGLTVTFTAVTADTPFGSMYASAVTSYVSVSEKIKDWQRLSPLTDNTKWYYRIVHKNKPNEILNVVGLQDSKVVINNYDYYYFYVPQENKGNVVKFSKEGAFIRNLKFPVFGFIYLNVILQPEIQYMRFPLKVGDTWECDSTGTVYLMNLIKINRKTKAKFTVLGESNVILDGKKEHVFRIEDQIDKGDGKTEREETWYAVDIGLVYQDTEDYTLELYKFVPGAGAHQTEAVINVTDAAPLEKL